MNKLIRPGTKKQCLVRSATLIACYEVRVKPTLKQIVSLFHFKDQSSDENFRNFLQALPHDV